MNKTLLPNAEWHQQQRIEMFAEALCALFSAAQAVRLNLKQEHSREMAWLSVL